MIQALHKSNLTAYLQTEDNRINTGVPSSYITYLFKFTNDMDGSVQYSYPESETIYNRYTKFEFDYNAVPDRYLGRINFSPPGYWKYEVYEVSFGKTVPPTPISANFPSTELSLLTADVSSGVVQGLVTKGKMYVAEAVEEVTYIQNAKSVQTLTIAYGGAGYITVAPVINIAGECITQATATCTIAGGVVNTVTITDAGSGYTENPTVMLTGGSPSEMASIVANINTTNYIYTG